MEGVTNTLYLTVFSCMNYGYQEIVNRSVNSGEICLPNNSNTSNEERIEALEKIISILAKDSISDSVSSKVNMIRTINNCLREENKNFNKYVDGFYGYAQAYHNLCGSTEDGKHSQTFAMVLLENSNQQTVTFNNVVSLLIAAARLNQVTSETYHQISESKLGTMKDILTTILDINTHQSDKDTSEKHETRSEQINIAEAKECLEIMRNILNPHKFFNTEKPGGSLIRLEDPVAAIRDPQIENLSDKKTTNNIDEGTKITRNMINGKGYHTSGFSNKRSSFSKKGICRACGKRNHQWKDCICEMHPLNRKRSNPGRKDQSWTKKKKPDNEKDYKDKEEESKPEEKQFFQ